MTYNKTKGKVYALLKDQAKSDDILKAAFHVRYTCICCIYLPANIFLVMQVTFLQAHVLLHFIRSSSGGLNSSQKQEDALLNSLPTTTNLEAEIAASCKMVSTSYEIFKSKASEQVGK